MHSHVPRTIAVADTEAHVGTIVRIEEARSVFAHGIHDVAIETIEVGRQDVTHGIGCANCSSSRGAISSHRVKQLACIAHTIGAKGVHRHCQVVKAWHIVTAQTNFAPRSARNANC